MADKFVVDTLVSLFKNEIKNTINVNDTEIVVTLKDGSRVKISAKKES